MKRRHFILLMLAPALTSANSAIAAEPIAVYKSAS